MDSVHLWRTVEKLVFPTIPDTFPGKKLGDIELDPIEDVPGLCERIAAVIRETNAQIIGIQERPPRADQMQAFVDQFLGENTLSLTPMLVGSQFLFLCITQHTHDLVNTRNGFSQNLVVMGLGLITRRSNA